MALLKQKGIVLGRRTVGESDVIFRLLPESGPILTLRAYGLRASQKRSPLVSEPGTLISTVYYGEESLGGSMKEAEVQDRFDAIKASYDGSLLLATVLETTEEAASANEGSDLYQLLYGALGTLQSRFAEALSAEWTHLFLGFFGIRLLKILGLLANATECSSCSAPLGKRAAFGGAIEISFLCSDCSAIADHRTALLARLTALSTSWRFAIFLPQAQELIANERDACKQWSERVDDSLESLFGKRIAARAELYRRLENRSG